MRTGLPTASTAAALPPVRAATSCACDRGHFPWIRCWHGGSKRGTAPRLSTPATYVRFCRKPVAFSLCRREWKEPCHRHPKTRQSSGPKEQSCCMNCIWGRQTGRTRFYGHRWQKHWKGFGICRRRPRSEKRVTKAARLIASGLYFEICAFSRSLCLVGMVYACSLFTTPQI